MNTERQPKNTPPQHVLGLEPGSTASDWHRHPNGGGWVHRAAWVADTAYVGPDAAICGRARVSGNAVVCEGARVSGDAIVRDSARVCGSVVVSGDAVVCGSVIVSGYAEVSGTARIHSGEWDEQK